MWALLSPTTYVQRRARGTLRYAFLHFLARSNQETPQQVRSQLAMSYLPMSYLPMSYLPMSYLPMSYLPMS